MSKQKRKNIILNVNNVKLKLFSESISIATTKYDFHINMKERMFEVIVMIFLTIRKVSFIIKLSLNYLKFSQLTFNKQQLLITQILTSFIINNSINRVIQMSCFHT